MKFRSLATIPPGSFEDRQVVSLTRNLRTYTDNSGVRYYLKDDPQGHEAQQLQALDGLRMPLPDRGAQASDTLGLQDGGRTLYSVMQGAPKEAQIRYAQKAGNLLQTFHRRAEHVAPEVLSEKPQETAHTVRNFRHRFVDLQSESSKAMLFGTVKDMSPEIWDIAQYLLSQIDLYQNRVSDIVTEEEDGDVIYGDFKPENLLVGAEDGLVMIDPELTHAHRAFDIAKFFSRSVIDNFKPSAIRAFVTGYHSEYDLSAPVYGDLSTRDIATKDLINIFSSYIGRGLQRNSEHRLVREIRQDGRITKLLAQISRLTTPSRHD